MCSRLRRRTKPPGRCHVMKYLRMMLFVLIKSLNNDATSSLSLDEKLWPRKHKFKSLPFSSFACAAANSRMKYCHTQNYIKTQSRRQGRKKKRKKDGKKEEWWGRTRKASCAKPSLPVKQIKLESRGSAAKSRAESESFSGTEIILHSSVVLTNPGSACARLATRDDMTPLKTETGRDSKRRGPDSVERNQCQDDL